MNVKSEILTAARQALEPGWDAPNLAALGNLRPVSEEALVSCRLFRVAEIGEDKAGAYRLAMANALSTLCATPCAAVYLLVGDSEGVSLHIGVSATRRGVDLHEIGDNLKAAFEGNFLGARLERLSNEDLDAMTLGKHVGIVCGVPTLNEGEAAAEAEFQGVERLADSLYGESWTLAIVAEPGSDAEIRAALDEIYALATELSKQVRQSVQYSENASRQTGKTSGTSRSSSQGTSLSDTRGENDTSTEGKSEDWSKSEGRESTSGGKNWSRSKGTNDSRTTGSSDTTTTGTNASDTSGDSHGASRAVTLERIDKEAERFQKHLGETLLERFLRGRSKGMFRTAVYLGAEKKSVFERLSRGVLSLYQSDQANVTPLRVEPFESALRRPPPEKLRELLRLRRFEGAAGLKLQEKALTHSLALDFAGGLAAATWLNVSELALLAGLPGRELPGLKIRKSVDFALNPGAASAAGRKIRLGPVMQHGRPLEKAVELSTADLDKHVFVTGVTGAGKTTTCMTLLLESGLPFLVIEPAKTEYRALHGRAPDVEYYALGREDLTPFRLNPFEMLRGQRNLASHVATLKATLAAVFPLEAAMPQMVEEAILDAYKARGWDVHGGANVLADDPWAPESDVWPNFSDMIRALDAVIESKGLGKEFEEKYRGSLVARFTSLTLGVKGRMLNARRSLDFSRLLDRKIVIELEEVRDEEDKALFMGLLLRHLAECVKQRHREAPGFRHLTLIEEAHRLLSRPEPGEGGAKKMGVEMFANLLSEVRKYGEGLIIADQIPNKLVSDVIKNTNAKIVHRLFAADDRDAIGDSIGLSREQKDFLPLLQPGETVVFCGGWHGAVRVRIDQRARTDAPEIAEAEIRAQGRRQIWEQRESLSPRLAAHPAMREPEAFADFLSAGPSLVNMLLRINASRSADARRGLAQAQRLRIAGTFARGLSGWSARLGLSLEEAGGLLERLMADCGLEVEIAYGGAAACVPTGAAKLAESLEAFDAWAEGDRTAKFVFGSATGLPGVDSI